MPPWNGQEVPQNIEARRTNLKVESPRILDPSSPKPEPATPTCRYPAPVRKRIQAKLIKMQVIASKDRPTASPKAHAHWVLVKEFLKFSLSSQNKGGVLSTRGPNCRS